MAYIIQQRRDTIENWDSINPILAPSELGFIIDLDENGKQKSSLYKIGDGRTAWLDLPLFGFGGNVYDNFEGDDLNISVPSRQAVLNEILKNSVKLDGDIKSWTDDKIEDLIKIEGKDYSKVLVSKETLLKKFKELEDSIKENSDKDSNFINTTTTQLDTINSNIDGIETNISDINSNIDGIETNISDINSNIDGIETNISDINSNIDGIETNITNLSESLNNANETISDINDKVNSLHRVLSEDEFEQIVDFSEYEGSIFYIYDEEK